LGAKDRDSYKMKPSVIPNRNNQPPSRSKSSKQSSVFSGMSGDDPTRVRSKDNKLVNKSHINIKESFQPQSDRTSVKSLNRTRPRSRTNQVTLPNVSKRSKSKIRVKVKIIFFLCKKKG
jgi:hypothetical protein